MASVDVAKLLEPIVAMMITGEAKLAEIPARINMGDAGDDEFFRNISETKYNMKTDKGLQEPSMPMDTGKSIDIQGLMARGE